MWILDYINEFIARCFSGDYRAIRFEIMEKGYKQKIVSTFLTGQMVVNVSIYDEKGRFLYNEKMF